MIRVKTSLDHKRIRRLIWLVLTVFVLLGYSLQSVAGSAYYSMFMQAYGTVSSPPVILQNGTAGTSTIYANKTSAKTSVEAPLFDYVDNNDSDVDSSADRGMHSNFTAQQAGPDSTYDTLTEENTGEITKVGTDTSGTGTNLTLSFSHTLVSGTNRIVIVSIGVENGNTTDVSTVTYGGVTMTLAVERITGTSGFRYLAEIWYILENDLPSDGSQTVEITCSGIAYELEVNGFCSEYTGVTQGAPEATDGASQSSGNTISNTISPSDDAWVISIAGSGNAGSFTHGQGQVEVLDFQDASSTFAVAELRRASGETSLSSTYSGTVNRLCRVAASWTERARYELDLEVQWASADYTRTNEELCIKTGTFSGSENIQVRVWNSTGSSWHWVMNLTASQWNNVSITSYLTSSTFTIQFLGGTEMGDTTQDSWNIDATLLLVWTAESTYDYVDNNTWDVDSSADKGTHGNFTAQQYGPDSIYDTLTEDNTGVVSNVTFFEDWESGSIASENWTIYSSAAQGRIVVDTDTPYEGSYALWMDVDTGGTYSLNELITNFDFSGATQVVLDFYHSEHGDENEAGSDHTDHQNADGVYYTLDGSYWYHLVDLVDPSGWTNVNINVTADPDFQGPVNSSFAIKFTQYDNWPRTNDGRGFENINITYQTAGENYELDLEVQWTDASYLLPNQELCIRTGATGTEDVKVDVWNGTEWINVLTNLTPNSWNNVSVSSYLTSSNFTIRFKGGNETGDTTQDSWNIDATVLHVWTSEGTYDYVLRVVNQETNNWTVNLQVYDSVNIGRLSSLNISLHDGTSSNQIAASGGSIVKSEGEPYNLPEGLGSTIYISISNLQATTTDISYLYVYLKVRVPNSSTYILYVITFEVT